MKELNPRAGEIKSMRTQTGFLRRGVGQAILDEIVRVARERNYFRLYLETGTGVAFEPAHALYQSVLADISGGLFRVAGGDVFQQAGAGRRD